jgi:hypothetical protein
MKLNYREDPKEWRKAVLLPALGLAILSSLLRWRHHLSDQIWLTVLGLAFVLALSATWQPRWFRGWYRLSLRLGFYSSQFVGRGVLAIFFFLILTPVGWALRIAGKDPLQLKRPANAQSYWQTAKAESPLDRLF